MGIFGLLICLVSAAVFLLWKDQLVPDLSGIKKSKQFRPYNATALSPFSLFP